MRRRSILVVIAASGCGRLGFDPIAPDAATSIGTANVAFATAAMFAGNLGGLPGADALCQTDAAAAGLAGTFIAWLSTDTTSGFSRLAGSRGWRLVDGTPFADDPSDLVTSAILHPLSLDASGADVRASLQPELWTGMQVDGTPSAGQTCQSWTSGSPADDGQCGDSRSGGSAFVATTLATCDQASHLACLEVGRVAQVVVEPVAGRHAFISAEAFVPNPGGISSADQLCAYEATVANLSGAFRALLPLAGMASMARFDTSRLTWIRPDGMPLAPTAAELFAAPFLSTSLDTTADGTRISTGTLYDAGDPTAPTAATCADWTSPTAPGAPTLGVGFATDHPRFFTANGGACGDPNDHLLCLEE